MRQAARGSTRHPLSIFSSFYNLDLDKMSDSPEIECVDLLTSDEESVNGYVS